MGLRQLQKRKKNKIFWEGEVFVERICNRIQNKMFVDTLKKLLVLCVFRKFN